MSRTSHVFTFFKAPSKWCWIWLLGTKVEKWRRVQRPLQSVWELMVTQARRGPGSGETSLDCRSTAWDTSSGAHVGVGAREGSAWLPAVGLSTRTNGGATYWKGNWEDRLQAWIKSSALDEGSLSCLLVTHMDVVCAHNPGFGENSGLEIDIWRQPIYRWHLKSCDGMRWPSTWKFQRRDKFQERNLRHARYAQEIMNRGIQQVVSSLLRFPARAIQQLSTLHFPLVGPHLAEHVASPNNQGGRRRCSPLCAPLS